jgi:hypothetical protein
VKLCTPSAHLCALHAVVFTPSALLPVLYIQYCYTVYRILYVLHTVQLLCFIFSTVLYIIYTTFCVLHTALLHTLLKSRCFTSIVFLYAVSVIFYNTELLTQSAQLCFTCSTVMLFTPFTQLFVLLHTILLRILHSAQCFTSNIILYSLYITLYSTYCTVLYTICTSLCVLHTMLLLAPSAQLLRILYV